MLSIKRKSTTKSVTSKLVVFSGALLLVAGVYTLALAVTPAVSPLFIRPIDVAALPAPKTEKNRIIIPKIGVNIHYAEGEASLDRGAEWRFPSRGNPRDGGNFIVAAHRFSIQPTPMGTLEASPFFHINKMVLGDEIVIDYDGERYQYKVEEIFTVKPHQVEIEDPSDVAKLTLYTCDLAGPEADRVVLLARLTSAPEGSVGHRAVD